MRGVGPKSAVALLAEWDDLEAIYADVDAVAGLTVRGAKALRDRLVADRELAELSKRLATVVDTVEIDGSVEDLVLGRLDITGLEATCERLGFRTLADRVRRQWGTDQ